MKVSLIKAVVYSLVFAAETVLAYYQFQKWTFGGTDAHFAHFVIILLLDYLAPYLLLRAIFDWKKDLPF